MLTVTDQLTEIAKKINDLKDQIKNSPSSNTKSEEKNKETSSTETEPVNNNAEESDVEGEGESEGEGNDEESTYEQQPIAETPVTQSPNAAPLTPQTEKPVEMPSYGSTPSTDSLIGNNLSLSSLPGTTPNAMQPGMQPGMQSAMQPTMPNTGVTQPNYFDKIPVNNNLKSDKDNNIIPIIDSKNLGGGKKHRKTKSANTVPKRKRRTRRNKKVMAETEGQADTQEQSAV